MGETKGIPQLLMNKIGLSLVFAIVFGFFIWSEVPKILTLLGAALVITSSLIIFMRENKLKKQIVTPRA